MSKAWIVIGLQYGDEGKGSVVAALTARNKSRLTVRFGGGAQCAHNVVTDDGHHHTFRQFGSGTFYGADTLLSKYMMVNPILMLHEAEQLESNGISSPLRRVFVDENALITTPYHRAVNRIREYAREENIHGSCGVGIGETAADALENPSGALIAYDLLSRTLLRKRLNATMDRMYAKAVAILGDSPTRSRTEVVHEMSTFEYDIELVLDYFLNFRNQVSIVSSEQAHTMIRGTEATVYEGHQGVLLDETYGWHPYTTWSKTTSANAFQILQDACYTGGLSQIGVTRTYATRHGPGPFVTEDSYYSNLLRDERNTTNDWQKDFRVGALDLPMLRYALQVNGPVDGLAVTHYDAVETRPCTDVCYEYELDGAITLIQKPESPTLASQEAATKRLFKMRPIVCPAATANLLPLLHRDLKTPVVLKSCGPQTGKKMFYD